MNLFNFLNRRSSAPVARERLQILLAHERTSFGGHSDLVALLREEILEVITRRLQIDPDKVNVRMERGDAVSTLAVDVEIPTAIPHRMAVGA